MQKQYSPSATFPRAILAFGVAAVMAVVVGCASSRAPGRAAWTSEVVQIDRSLQRAVGVTYETTGRTPHSNSLRAVVQLEGRAGREVFMEYRFVFMDRFGAEIHPAAPWRSLSLRPGARASVESVSTDSDAEAWVLKIRSTS